jgi:hypothetical protein
VQSGTLIIPASVRWPVKAVGVHSDLEECAKAHEEGNMMVKGAKQVYVEERHVYVDKEPHPHTV